MEFCYLIIFESTRVGKIEPVSIEDDDPKLVEETLEELGYEFRKPLKRKESFSRLKKEGTVIYYRTVPCLKVNDRFFELKEITNL